MPMMARETGGQVGKRRVVIFNADDFGLTGGTNAGIIGAFRHGLVRSASLMVTTPGFADAVELARAHPGLDLGVHLALTGVAPVLPAAQIPSLVDRQGHFPHPSAWLGRALSKRLRPTEVHAELRAQLLRAFETGLPFSHIDSHHHVHLFAPVARIVGALAREFGLPVVRREGLPGAPFLRVAREARDTQRVNNRKGRLLAVADAHWGGAFFRLSRTDAFRGFVFPTDLDGWLALADSCPAGVTEIMCHPGLVDPDVAELDSYVAERELELRWLCDRRVAAIFAAADIALGDFGQVAPPAASTRPSGPPVVMRPRSQEAGADMTRLAG
jgi:predicted glycoside hydrolase/deacetylase ChbG (UPF0249 family)